MLYVNTRHIAIQKKGNQKMINNFYDSNKALFESELLSVNDVLLKPNLGIVSSRSSINTACRTGYIMSAPMDKVTGYELCKSMLAALQTPVLSRFIDPSERSKAILEFAGNWNFWIAVSADFEKEIEYLRSLLKDKLDGSNPFLLNICIDVAHGHTREMGNVYKKWRSIKGVYGIMSGSIATPEAALFCMESGCNYLRVGIGPGSACTTRLVTGVGYPQLSAVFEINKLILEMDKAVLNRHRTEVWPWGYPTIIADGGISTSGDIVKYLSAGANMVMLGKLLSYAEESCGWEDTMPKRKKYRGQASQSFQEEIYGKSNHVEGESSADYYYPKYTVKEFLNQMDDGVKSAISYLGGDTIHHLNPNSVKFIRITQNSWNESKTNL